MFHRQFYEALQGGENKKIKAKNINSQFPNNSVQISANVRHALEHTGIPKDAQVGAIISTESSDSELICNLH